MTRLSSPFSPHLRGEVVLLQLATLPQVPGPDRVVQTSGPKLGAIVRDVDTAGAVCVTLELPATPQKADKRSPMCSIG